MGREVASAITPAVTLLAVMWLVNDAARPQPGAG